MHKLNNIDDPFSEGNITINTKYMEHTVLNHYARLWDVMEPHNKDNLESYWASCSPWAPPRETCTPRGTHAAISAARRCLWMWKVVTRPYASRARPVNVPQFIYHSFPLSLVGSDTTYTHVAFYSKDTHYSIAKTMFVLGV